MSDADSKAKAVRQQGETGSGTSHAGGGVAWGDLIAQATAVRLRAYAPYSHYQVGAALCTSSGEVFVGCNVENASYGLCLCAERNAIAQMISAGRTDPLAIAVVTQGPEAGTPCGMCRQTLAEFAPRLRVGVAVLGDTEPRVVYELDELLPHAFRGDLVHQP